MEWTQELHDRFVCAVEALPAKEQIPSRILDHMGPLAGRLTRQNVASHLQKYRVRRKAQDSFCRNAPAYYAPTLYPCWAPYHAPMPGAPAAAAAAAAAAVILHGCASPISSAVWLSSCMAALPVSSCTVWLYNSSCLLSRHVHCHRCCCCHPAWLRSASAPVLSVSLVTRRTPFPHAA